MNYGLFGFLQNKLIYNNQDINDLLYMTRFFKCSSVAESIIRQHLWLHLCEYTGSHDSSVERLQALDD